MTPIEFENILFNLEMGWVSFGAYEQQLFMLTNAKKEVLENKDLYKAQGFDIEDIYRQIDEFTSLVESKKTHTGKREEAVILTALDYAKKSQPIIYSKASKNAEMYMIEQEQLLMNCRYYQDVTISLFTFYFQQGYDQYHNYILPTAIELFNLSNRFLKAFPNETSFNPIDYVILYLNDLKKNNDISTGEYIFNNVEIFPVAQSEIKQIEKLKAFFCRKKLT